LKFYINGIGSFSFLFFFFLGNKCSSLIVIFHSFQVVREKERKKERKTQKKKAQHIHFG